MISRRKMIASSAAAVAGGTVLLQELAKADDVPSTNRAREGTAAATGQPNVDQTPLPPGEPGKDYTPVVTPNGVTLPFKVVAGVKVFHLIAEEIDHEFAPGLKAKCWGYNGRTPGPTIEAVAGDRLRIYVTNHLPAPTTVHWHGVRVPNGMDGVNGMTQAAIPPGQTFRYEFTVPDAGTFM